MKYVECLDIDKNFEPVFSEETDSRNKDLWKSFIPHEDFEKLLNVFLKAIDRSNPQDNKSIWLFGSYGTGKTHAIFVLKHLLEDSDKEVEDYFSRYSRNISESIKQKIMALRKQDILVVFKSSAGHVDSATKLLLEIQQSIYNSYARYLKKKGLEYDVTKTDIQMLREKLESEVIDWEKVIQKHRSKIPEVQSINHVKDILDNGDVDFATRLLDILNEEGLLSWGSSINPEKLKNWIDEIIKQRVVSAIVFIWDEFSDFFTRSDAPLITLQEIAHLASKIPFYLIIVTHRPPEIWSQILHEDISKMKDRFHYLSYKMEPITIYKLISQVIRPKKTCEEFIESIWTKTISNYNFENEIYRLLEEEAENYSVKFEDFKLLLPIHPYTAYISTKIAEFFGSSNRTIFKFLKSNEEGAFMTFLENYPKDNNYLLTIDFLWDYFFVNNDEFKELHPETLYLINFWNTYKNKLNSSEAAALKAILLLFSLSEKIMQSSLLAPKLSVLKIAFAGTPIYSELEEILESLEEKRIVRLLRTLNDIEILRPTHDIDRGEIERIKKNLPDFPRFIKSIEKKFVDELILHRRSKLFVTTSDDILKGHMPKMNDAKDYEIKVVVILTKNSEGILKLRQKIKQMSERYKNVLFVFSSSELGEPGWALITENMAYSEYYKKLNKHKEVEYHNKNVESKINEWINRIKRGEFYTVINLDYEWNESVIEKYNVSGIDGLKTFFENEVIVKVFPYGLDNIIKKQALWENKNLRKKAIRAGIYLQESKNYTAVNEFYRVFHEKHGILDEDGNFIELVTEQNKEHPIVRIRDFVKTFFEQRDVVDLTEIWEDLQKPPFGLCGDTPVGCFAFALALRDYSNGYFAINDRGIEKEVTPDGLIEYVYETIYGRARWKFQKLSKEQREFCNLTMKLFNLSEEEAKTPKEAVQSIRLKLKKDYKYPIWILKYGKPMESEELDIIIDLLDSIIKTPLDQEEGLREQKLLINELSKTLDSLGDAPIEELKNVERDLTIRKIRDLIKQNSFHKCFENLIYGILPTNVRGIISIDEIDRKLRERLQEESYYWDENKVKEVLEYMVYEIQFTTKISEILSLDPCSPKFLDELKIRMVEKIKNGSLLPFWILRFHPSASDSEIINLFETLSGILYSEDLELIYKSSESIQRLNQMLEMSVDSLKDIFIDETPAAEIWLKEKLNGDLSYEEEVALIDEIYNTTSAKPLIKEAELINHLKKIKKEIRKRVLKSEIEKELEDVFGTSDIRSFLREQKIPLSLIKYFRRFAELETNNRVNISSFFEALIDMSQLPEAKLESILNDVKYLKGYLADLTNETAYKEVFKSFFGKEWVEGVFEDSDLEDLINYLKDRLGEKIESWSEVAIRSRFNEWMKEKYSDLIYSRLKEKIEILSETSLKELLIKLIEEPSIGLQIAKIMRG